MQQRWIRRQQESVSQTGENATKFYRRWRQPKKARLQTGLQLRSH